MSRALESVIETMDAIRAAYDDACKDGISHERALLLLGMAYGSLASASEELQRSIMRRCDMSQIARQILDERESAWEVCPDVGCEAKGRDDCDKRRGGPECRLHGWSGVGK